MTVRRRRGGLTQAGRLLDRAMRAKGQGPDPALAPIRDVWAAAVGDAVAAVAQPLRRSRAGVLTIACADASWATELQGRSDDLVDRVRERLSSEAGPVTGLRFVVSERPIFLERATKEVVRPRSPTPAQSKEAERLVAGVADPELRRILARAAAATLAGGPPDTKSPGKRRP